MRHAGPVLGPPTDPEAAIITNALVAFLPAASPATGPGAQLPIPNPFGWVGDGIGSLIRGLLRDLVDDFLKNLAEPVLRYVLHTPDLLAEPTLRRLGDIARGAVRPRRAAGRMVPRVGHRGTSRGTTPNGPVGGAAPPG